MRRDVVCPHGSSCAPTRISCPLAAELLDRLGHGRGRLDVELDPRLRHGAIGRPLGGAEGGLGGLAQRPDRERVDAGQLLGVEVPVRPR